VQLLYLCFFFFENQQEHCSFILEEKKFYTDCIITKIGGKLESQKSTLACFRVAVSSISVKTPRRLLVFLSSKSHMLPSFKMFQ